MRAIIIEISSEIIRITYDIHPVLRAGPAQKWSVVVSWERQVRGGQREMGLEGLGHWASELPTGQGHREQAVDPGSCGVCQHQGLRKPGSFEPWGPPTPPHPPSVVF